MTTSPDYPYRLVDRLNNGWLHTGGGSYQADTYRPHNSPILRPKKMQLPELDVQNGPLRPVLPLLADDAELLREAFRRCGRKTVTTVAAALEEVFHRLRNAMGGLGNATGSYDYAARTMIAGRSGSWESAVLIDVILFGNILNQRAVDNWVDSRRAASPSSRVHHEARDVMAGIFRRWVTDEHRYTEVAETLAFLVSHHADSTAYGGEGVRVADDPESLAGWKTVADQHLQPASLSRRDFVTCYRLFYSRSAHFNPDLLG